MNREHRYRLRLKAVGKGTGYEVGEEITLCNDIFDTQNGVAFFPLNKDWEILSNDQYTGLKDKSTSKEVYESDICHATFKTRDGYLNITGEIIWDELMWCIRDPKVEDSQFGDTFSLNRVEIIEVLGNIYSNPELIKQ